MRLGIIGNLVAHSRPQYKRAAILQLGDQLAFGAQQDVTLQAPVIGQVTRRVFDAADPDVAELLSSPEGGAALTLVLGGLNVRPVGDTKGNIGHLHVQLPPRLASVDGDHSMSIDVRVPTSAGGIWTGV